MTQHLLSNLELPELLHMLEKTRRKMVRMPRRVMVRMIMATTLPKSVLESVCVSPRKRWCVNNA